MAGGSDKITPFFSQLVVDVVTIIATKASSELLLSDVEFAHFNHLIFWGPRSSNFVFYLNNLKKITAVT